MNSNPRYFDELQNQQRVDDRFRKQKQVMSVFEHELNQGILSQIKAIKSDLRLA